MSQAWYSVFQLGFFITIFDIFVYGLCKYITIISFVESVKFERI